MLCYVTLYLHIHTYMHTCTPLSIYLCMPCHAMPCYSMLCYAMLCYAIYAMLCYAIYLSIHPSIYLSICLSIYQIIYLSTYLYICIYIYIYSMMISWLATIYLISHTSLCPHGAPRADLINAKMLRLPWIQCD